jgi:transposase InsO family protein
MRLHTVRWIMRLKLCGMTLIRASKRLGIPYRTAQEWVRRFKKDGLKARRRGRPLERGTPALRNNVFETLRALGPGTGVPTLRKHNPDLPFRELLSLKKRYARAYKRRKKRLSEALTWTRPGSVWSIDFTEPPTEVDGKYRYLLCVEDLSSGCNLETIPVVRKRSFQVKQVLEHLCRKHGPPLVIKADNDSCFTKGVMKYLHEKYGVSFLFSPAYMPWYNGGVESCIGRLKPIIFHRGSSNGRPYEWSSGDVHAGCILANETVTKTGMTHSEIFERRVPLSSEERFIFLNELESQKKKVLESLEKKAGEEPNGSEKAIIQRRATRDALIKCGYLTFRRRWITPALKRQNYARIS